LQKHGTKAKKAGNGIEITQKTHGCTRCDIPAHVRNAGKNLKAHSQRKPNSVTRIARLRRLENVAKPVYDLTVEFHHCYFANGFLVSNSDSFRYLAQAVQVMPSSLEYDYVEAEAPDWRT
jgi:hypothetical protein